MLMKPLPRPARVSISLLSAVTSGVEAAKAVRELKDTEEGSQERTEKTIEVVSRVLLVALLVYGTGYQAAKK
jgi:hypothetical protein